MNIEKLQEDFEIYGLNAVDENVLNKCVELCDEYNLSAEQLAIQWLGFATVYDYNEITIDTLQPFETQELKKNNVKSTNSNPAPGYIPTTDQDELLAAYGASPANRPHKAEKRKDSPVQKKSKRSIASSLEESKDFLSNSPAANTPSQKYSARNNAGTVVCSVGANKPKARIADGSFVPEVIIGKDSLSDNYEYMFEPLRSNAFVLEDSMGDIADAMREVHSIEEWSPVSVTSNTELWFMGRVCCDSNGRLNAVSVMLEGNREDSSALMVKLDLSKMSSYSLFPGQVIAVKGVNSTGSCIIAKEIIPGICLGGKPLKLSLKQDVNIKIACGPFTTIDNLLFEPLSDFLKQVALNPPEILILIGPLVSSSHPLLMDDDLAETLDSVASFCMSMIARQLQDCEIKIFVLSSSDDVDCPSVFPTPPRTLPNELTDLNITTLADPSILFVEGVPIGITATDILMDLSREEISFPAHSMDRLSRLSQHLLQQQSFYPLYPPPEEFALCLGQWESHARLSFTPAVMVVPSNMRYFVKELKDCVMVNPERLAKGYVGGYYANVTISKDSTEKPVINTEIIKI